MSETSPAAPYIHPQALCASTNIGNGTRVWAFAQVMRDVVVGDGCNICGQTYLDDGVRIGDRVTVKNGVLLFDRVLVEDDVFLGPGAVTTNDLFPRSGPFKNGPDKFLSTTIAKGATVGANVTIVCGTNIGRYAMVGAGAVVNRNVPAHALVVGNPARPIGYVCMCGERLTHTLTCGDCQRSYAKTADGGLNERTTAVI